MVLLSLLLAPCIMCAAVWASQQWGASAGGWVAALPISLPVAVAALAMANGTRTADEFVWSAAAHVVAQVIFAVTFARAIRRAGLIRGLVCGTTAYGLCAVAVAALPAVLATAAAVPALLLAPRLMPAHRPLTPAPQRWPTTAVTCLGASLVVAAAVFGSRLAGPGAGGTLAAFPTMSSLLTIVIVKRSGRAGGVHTLAGLVRSLPCYLTFCLLAAITLPLLGVAGDALALLACLTAARVTWRTLPPAAPLAVNIGP